MKKLLLLLPLLPLLLIAAPSPKLGTVKVEWTYDFSASPGMTITNFMVYWGPASNSYNSTVLVGGTNLTMTIGGFIRNNTYWFTVTALADNNLESDYAAAVSFRIPNKPNPATNVVVAIP